MGVSTDAILAFGFNLLDEEESLAALFGEQSKDDDGEAFEFDDWIARQAGATYPEGHSGINSPEYRAYAAKRDAAIAACPVEIITHCSYDSPMYFLALRGTETRAWRGSPKAVETPPPAPEQIDAMLAFCVSHRIEWKEPAWHIFSLWG
jgi:hypothetical protein